MARLGLGILLGLTGDETVGTGLGFAGGASSGALDFELSRGIGSCCEGFLLRGLMCILFLRNLVPLSASMI